MVDQERRRILRLGALATASLAGGGFLLAARLRSDDSGDAVTAGTSSSTTNPKATTTEPQDTTTSAPATSTTKASVAAAGAGSMLCRDAWGAKAPTGSLPPHEIRGLMVHHTAVTLADNRQAPARVRGHQRFHQSRGFVDIAYHVVVDLEGNVYEGRDQGQPGETFTDYDPTGWFLVVCEGNFDEQLLPNAQRDAMVRVLAWASRHYGLPSGDIASHRQHAHTRCPGDAIHSLVVDGTLARLVTEQAAAGATLDVVCGPEATARVAAIEAGT